MLGIIYKYENKINGKVYIGKTTNEKKRIESHKKDCKKINTKFYRAVRKYGWKNFDYQVLEKIESEDLIDLEKQLSQLEKDKIEIHNSKKGGYNSTLGGEGLSGFKHTDNSRRLMSIKRKILYQNNLIDRRNIPILQFTKNGDFIREWNSINEASLNLQTSHAHLSSCCKYKRKSAFGYKWIYKHECEDIKNQSKISEYLKTNFEIEKRFKNSRPVCQLSLDGEYISEFRSMGKVIEELGKEAINVKLVCKSMSSFLEDTRKSHHRDFCLGYRWCYKSDWDDEKKREKLLYYFQKTYKESFIIQFTKDGRIIGEYRDSGECYRKTGINATSILENCKRRVKSAGGFVWKFKRDISDI